MLKLHDFICVLIKQDSYKNIWKYSSTFSSSSFNIIFYQTELWGPGAEMLF